MVRHVPSIHAHVSFRKQTRLDLRSQFQIALQQALLFRRQAVEAETHQRIGNQFLVFNRIVAVLTDSECTLFDPP